MVADLDTPARLSATINVYLRPFGAKKDTLPMNKHVLRTFQCILDEDVCVFKVYNDVFHFFVRNGNAQMVDTLRNN
jgi:hypothetical protein